MSISHKAYRLLLRAYPHRYRIRYAEPMEQLFRDQFRESRTFARRAALWARTLADWAISVPARHWEREPPHFAVSADPFRRCIFFACCEACSFSRTEIAPEHLLLGILHQQPSLIPGAAREAVVRALEDDEPSIRRRFARAKDLRLSWASRRALVAAEEIAHADGRSGIAPRDLMAAILRETDTLAARLLREHRSEGIGPDEK